MNIHSFIGNLKAGTSCLGTKWCPLIGHLGTVKGGGVMQCGQGWLGARSVCEWSVAGGGCGMVETMPHPPPATDHSHFVLNSKDG